MKLLTESWCVSEPENIQEENVRKKEKIRST